MTLSQIYTTCLNECFVDPEFDVFDPPIIPESQPLLAEEQGYDWNQDGYCEPLERWHDRAYTRHPLGE